ncbi:rod shape-determining protein MreC [Gynurincola endophyticus]|uniref:rod shape-determining protein MreC n=1 Tax=Gynurincola endophyticus TaxID=2479004 RepID=UPI000F8D747A|nr:rod shape-determining protein MreC [Gynurincola endophyticus]
MRNIFLFLKNRSKFIIFVALQVIALWILFKYNKFHEAAYLGVAGEITGRINQQYNKVEYYFQLKQTNDALVRENLELRQQLAQNFEAPDTSFTNFTDTVNFLKDNEQRKYRYRSAKVLNNTYTLTDNYLTIHIGTAQGVQKDMGVIGADGVVGTIVNAGKNFSVVMSLLHHQSKLSARHLRSGETGSVYWEGESPFELTMTNVQKSVEVKVGDTIVTSQYASYRYPQGIMIGTVIEVEENNSRNFHTLKLRPSTHFNRLEWVTVVENLQLEEQLAIEESTRKN